MSKFVPVCLGQMHEDEEEEGEPVEVPVNTSCCLPIFFGISCRLELQPHAYLCFKYVHITYT